MMTFAEFLESFFAIFARKSFQSTNFIDYLALADSQRSGDEASIVDTAIVNPILELLGFPAGDRGYNRQHLGERPDFAPSAPIYGTCFVIEDKSTSLSLTLDRADADSHLSQLQRYTRGIRFGWLTNGKRLIAWDFGDPGNPRSMFDLEIPTAIEEWNRGKLDTLSEGNRRALENLFDRFRRESFTDVERLEEAIALDREEWQRQALPLGNESGNEPILVESLQSLVVELQRHARNLLERHLSEYGEYQEKANRLADDSIETATEEIRRARERVWTSLDGIQNLIGLNDGDRESIEAIFTRLEKESRAYINPNEIFREILAILQQTYQRKHGKPPAKELTLEKDYPNLNDALKPYVEKVFAWHQRQATLRQTHQADIRVHDDYTVWTALVQETMLGGLDETRRREEFALQAAYVVFIRLLLIRVCEDKGVFPNRFVSDGGIKRWQENIQYYWQFATGNPYGPLMDMAYNNAGNIYAHFFTGRELFNWFVPDKQQLVMTLHQLSRFNFAGVDSDIVGTVYSTYVDRKEKKEKGQYYTPPEIVNYILDEVGYRVGAGIIGANKRLIDPACGSGSFLVAAAKRLVETYRRNADEIDDPVLVLNRVRDNLYGFDLNPFACYLSEVNLLIQVLDLVKLAHDRGRTPRIDRFHIYNVDALARPRGAYRALMFNTLIAEESDLVDQMKSRSPNTPYENGFAFVVANPPYGASITKEYQQILKADFSDVFYGHPDSYVFFMKLGIELLATGGKFGFITPNTYFMGKNTATLRKVLLESSKIEQIVDLPQGIWEDANVDCALIFLTQESNRGNLLAQQPKVNLLDVRDSLDKLTERNWTETIQQEQSRWLENSNNEINIRYDSLIQKIENACYVRVQSNGNGSTEKILRLGDITDSSPGIDPYKTSTDGKINRYIKPRQNLPTDKTDWKPLLDSNSFIGRYELRWGKVQHYIKYGNWLCRPREKQYFDEPKLLVQDMRNRALSRRLVATFDDKGFYNRKNFSNIIRENPDFEIKYLLALFNSSLLNFWFARLFDNLHINPSYFRQLPIYPADEAIQTELVEKVDRILETNARLNGFRERGYIIRKRKDGSSLIEIPPDRLLEEIRQNRHDFNTLPLFDARAIELFTIPDRCDLQYSISQNVYIPDRYPDSIVLKHNKLWFVVEDERLRRYLLAYLKLPRWRGKIWDEIKNIAVIPAESIDLDLYFQAEQQRRDEIQNLLDEVARIDAEIDEKVFDLYGITDPIDRQRVLGSASPFEEEEDSEEDNPSEETE